MAVTLDGLTVELPKQWGKTVMKEAFESSVVGSLTNQIPVSTRGNVIPVYEGGFEVGYVAEAEAKPVSEVGISLKYLVPQKFAGIVVVSKEAARENPANMLDIMRRDMVNAVSRQVDFGIFYGKSAKTGAPVPNVTSVNSTTNRVELAPGDLVPQVLTGYDLASVGEADPNGFAFDPRLRTRIAQASVQEYAPTGGVTPMPSLTGAGTTLGGLPVSYGRTVSGRVGSNAATDVRGFVGDWNKLQWGFSSDISMQRSDQATVVDGSGTVYHLFQQNLIAYLIEFEAGWWIDPTAFAAFDQAAPGA